MLAPQSKRTQLDSENVQSVELFITIELCIIELSQFRYTVLLFVFPPFAGKFVWCIFTSEWNTMANTKRRNPNANWTNIQFFLLICFFSPFKMGKHISTPTFPFRCIRFSMPSQFSNFFCNFFPLRNIKIQMESYQKTKQTIPTPKCRKHPNKQFTCNFHRWLSFRVCLTVSAVFLLLRLSCNYSTHNFVIFCFAVSVLSVKWRCFGMLVSVCVITVSIRCAIVCFGLFASWESSDSQKNNNRFGVVGIK